MPSWQLRRRGSCKELEPMYTELVVLCRPGVLFSSDAGDVGESGVAAVAGGDAGVGAGDECVADAAGASPPVQSPVKRAPLPCETRPLSSWAAGRPAELPSPRWVVSGVRLSCLRRWGRLRLWGRSMKVHGR